jgi:hypothetical protein
VPAIAAKQSAPATESASVVCHESMCAIILCF